MNRRLLVLAGCTALVLAGCTEVPTTSPPEIVGSQGLGTPAQPPNPPKPGETPFFIVSDFLAGNADSDANHAGARQYLTASERSRWTDDRVTVVSNTQASVVPGRPDTVRVDVPVLGTVDATGVYKPVLIGDGNGHAQNFTFQTKQVKVPKYVGPQWRIDKLQSGLIISSAVFQQQFQQRSIYFYDATEQHLVPDPRYTSLVDPTLLADWLLSTLAAGPRDALAAAEQTEFPEQTDPQRVSVQLDTDPSSPVKIKIPGSAQLNPTTRTKLAVQVAATLAQVPQIGATRDLTIYDGTKAVSIPTIGAAFSATDFEAQITPSALSPVLYYVDAGGGVVDVHGRPLPGKVGSGYYDLTSVALKPGPGTDGLLIAGTRGSGNDETLDIGSEVAPLEPVARVAGPLSRPAWAPDFDEAWIGAGSTLYRVSTTGVAQKVPMSTTDGPASGQILAVRLSPEGSRIAVVLKSPTSNGVSTSQVYVGNVVRGGGTVQVVGLTPITATGIVVVDVAWNDRLKLFAIGQTAVGGEAGYYEFQSDGSHWSARGTSSLPGPPDTITVASGHVLAVSAAGSVWTQSGGTWLSPHGDETEGGAPIYVE